MKLREAQNHLHSFERLSRGRAPAMSSSHDRRSWRYNIVQLHGPDVKSWRCNENCSTTSQGLSKTSQPCCSCVQKRGDFLLVFMGFPCATKSSSMWRGSQSTGCLRCRLEMLTLGVFCFGPVRYTFRPAHLQYSRLSQVDHIGNPFYSVQPQVHWESCESWRCFVIGKVVVQHALHSRRLSSQRSFGTCGRLKPRAQGTCDKHMTAYHHITTDNLWQPTVRRALIFQQWSDICC